MKYYIATRTRRRFLTYALYDTLEQAKENLQRYSHVWRIGIFEQDNQGYITKVV